MKGQQLGDIARLRDEKQARRQTMAKIVIWRGVSEIKYCLFQPNNIKIYEIYHDYIHLRIVFHTMLSFSENKKIQSLPSIFVISRIISCLPGIMYGHFLAKYYTYTNISFQ